MGKAVEETKKLIEQTENELVSLRDMLDKADQNHPMIQNEIMKSITEKQADLDRLKKLLNGLQLGDVLKPSLTEPTPRSLDEAAQHIFSVGPASNLPSRFRSVMVDYMAQKFTTAYFKATSEEEVVRLQNLFKELTKRFDITEKQI